MLIAVILAAGNSSRMGRTKALLKYKDGTFLGTVCAGVKSAAPGETIVVLGAGRAEVLSAWMPKEEKIVFNETPELGQIASVRAGLDAARPETEAMMICLVDQPTIAPRTYKLIADCWRANREFIVIPKCVRPGMPQATGHGSAPAGYPLRFKRGHPIVVPRKYFRLCFDGPYEKGLHWVTHHPAVKVLDLVVEDPGIIRDFDTPEEYARLEGGSV